MQLDSPFQRHESIDSLNEIYLLHHLIYKYMSNLIFLASEQAMMNNAFDWICFI